MKRFVIAIALACVLSGSALAGEMPTIGYAPPAPEPPQATLPGDMPTGDYAEETSTDITLTLLETILSLWSF